MDREPNTDRRAVTAARLSALVMAALIAASCATSAAPSASEPGSAPILPTVTPAPTATPSPAGTSAPSPMPMPQPTAQPAPQPTPQLPAADDETLAAVYAALRPENLRSVYGRRVFARGSLFDVRFEFVNRSSAPLRVPLTTAFDRSATWIGVIQTWIEPLDPKIDLGACLPTAGRKGAWYAVGGTSVISRSGPGMSIPPGAGWTMAYGVSPSPTACLPLGRYRYHLEYKRFDAGVEDVIAATALNLEIREAQAWAAGLATSQGERLSSTLELSKASTRMTHTLALAGLAPGTSVTVAVRAGGCDREGAVIVPARTYTANAEGRINERVRTRLTRSARRAITAGEVIGIRVAEAIGQSCTEYVARPLPVPANRAPTTWGGGLLRERTPDGIVVTASSQSLEGGVAHAADGVVDNMWNSGGYPPAWVELDLGRNTALTGVRLLPSQLPNIAETLHRVYGRKDGSRKELLLAELKGTTHDNVWINVPFAARQRIRYVRIETVLTPSWVAWREIQVQGPGIPPPSVMPQGTHDGSLDLVAYGERCYANGWASDPDDRTRRVEVRILVDGDQVWRGPASESRPDVGAAGFGDGMSGFWVRLDGQLELGVGHEIRVQALDAETGRWVDLNSTPRMLTCR